MLERAAEAGYYLLRAAHHQKAAEIEIIHSETKNATTAVGGLLETLFVVKKERDRDRESRDCSNYLAVSIHFIPKA